jgi:putative ABC transport system permease protein
MEQNLAASLTRPRLRTALLTLLAGLGLVLAAIGVHGVVAYSVAYRASELGIRAALGSLRSDLLWLVIRQGMKPVLAGLLLGVALVLGPSHSVRSLLLGIAQQDPLTLIAWIALLGVIGLVACLMPALRATRIEPAAALRRE